MGAREDDGVDVLAAGLIEQPREFVRDDGGVDRRPPQLCFGKLHQ